MLEPCHEHYGCKECSNYEQWALHNCQTETLKNLASAIKKTCPEVIPQIVAAVDGGYTEFLEFLRKP